MVRRGRPSTKNIDNSFFSFTPDKDGQVEIAIGGYKFKNILSKYLYSGMTTGMVAGSYFGLTACILGPPVLFGLLVRKAIKS